MMEGQIAAAAFLQDPSVDRNQDGVYQYVVLEGEPGHQDAIVRTEYSVNTIVSSGIEVENWVMPLLTGTVHRHRIK